MKKHDVKILVLVVILLVVIQLMSGCGETKVPETVKVVLKKELPMLAWGERPWTKTLMDAIESKEWSKDITNHCKHTEFKVCLGQTISIMAKYESGFKPETSYEESFKGRDGKNIISRGLFQISMSSSNQSAYKCNTKNVEQLHDPDHNIKCMVNIAHYWLNKDLVFFGGDKLGLGRYHSVGRKSSKSNAKILKYLEQF